MATMEIQRVLDPLLNDVNFRERFKADRISLLAEFNLSPEDRTLLLELDGEELIAAAESLEIYNSTMTITSKTVTVH